MSRILVIDDELDICLMLTMHLQNLRFEAQYATTVKEAQQSINGHHFDLLFVDLNLLEGSGYDVINYAHKLGMQAKIIIISAHDSESTIAIERGADLFIAKPFTIKAIDEALKVLNILPA